MHDVTRCVFAYLLVYGDNPPVSVVRKFVHLLDMGDVDYEEEIGKTHTWFF